MNENTHENCERFEALIAAWFDADPLSARERDELTTHVASCTSCRESFELASRMEAALVSRRDEVPAADAFLPAFAPARARVAVVRHAHPKLLAVFRTVMSPAGIAIMLTSWAAMLALHFRHALSEVFAFTASDRFAALSQDASNLLLNVSRGDTLVLTGIYVLLTMIVLGSMGAITLRYIRHS